MKENVEKKMINIIQDTDISTKIIELWIPHGHVSDIWLCSLCISQQDHVSCTLKILACFCPSFSPTEQNAGRICGIMMVR